MTFGDKIKKLRLEHDLRQEDLAKIIKVHRATIGKYETNERFPDKDVLKNLADYFDISVDYLLGRTNNRKEFIEPEEGISSENVKYKTYKEMLNRIIELMDKEGISSEVGDIDAKEAIELIFRHGAPAAIEILKLKQKDNVNNE